MVAAAAAELGLADGCYLFTQVRACLDSAPWLPGFDYHRMPELSRMLQTACYVVIAYLSGMRDSEVKHLQPGCLTRQLDVEGNVYRRTITSRAFKGETAKGVTASWVVSESVERAIGVLEQLQPDDAKYLFTALSATMGSCGTDRSRSVTIKCTNKNLNEFVDWINTYCATHNRVDAIPLVRRQRWRLTSGQFRRTLAWFIARRPGGAIAGAIQYRHHSIQMFEGYAGTSDSGFRGEVEAEQSLQRGERLLAMIENYEHLDLRGPAAGEAEERLTNLERCRAYTSSVVTDPRRLRRIMRSEDPHIYLGHFVTCVYNPDKALCRRQLAAAGDQTVPDLANCRPLQCRNVALTADNLQALTRQLHQLDAHLAAADLLAPFVAHRLTEQRRDLAALLDAATAPEEHPVTGHSLPGDDDVRSAADALLTEHREGGATPASPHWRRHSTSTAPRSIGTTPPSPTRCSTAPHNDTPTAQNDDLLATLTTTETKPSGASAPKTPTYESISRSTKNTFGCSPSTNSRYRDQLEGLAGVTDLSSHRNPSAAHMTHASTAQTEASRLAPTNPLLADVPERPTFLRRPTRWGSTIEQ